MFILLSCHNPQFVTKSLKTTAASIAQYMKYACYVNNKTIFEVQKSSSLRLPCLGSLFLWWFWKDLHLQAHSHCQVGVPFEIWRLIHGL